MSSSKKDKRQLLKKALKQRKERFRRKYKRRNLAGLGERELEEVSSEGTEATHRKETYLDELEKKKGEFHHFVGEEVQADFAGLVVDVYPRGGLIRTASGECVLCECVEYLYAKNETPVAAGDVAECIYIDEENYDYDGFIIGIKERTNVISIPEFRGKNRTHVYEKVLAANIDVFIIVDAVKNPRLNLAFIDRCLVIGQREGDKKTVLCINKADLCNKLPQEIQAYESYVDNIIFTSAMDNTGITQLGDVVAGSTAVMVGRSGVGKSSLLNKLCDISIETGAVAKKGQKGAHTTRRYSLYETDKKGMIIDTPGIKEISLMNIEPAELTWYFPEFIQYREECRFNDCTHTHEPDCGVKQAVEHGRIPAFRYENYVRILHSLESTRKF